MTTPSRLQAKTTSPRTAHSSTAYVSLLAQIRRAHPAAPIVCVVTPGTEDVAPDFTHTRLLSNIKAAILMFADSSVTVIAPALAEKSELTGCDYHPNALLQTRMAITIAQAVNHALYMEALK